MAQRGVEYPAPVKLMVPGHRVECPHGLSGLVSSFIRLDQDLQVWIQVLNLIRLPGTYLKIGCGQMSCTSLKV